MNAVEELITRGSQLIETDAKKAQELISKGIKRKPNLSIGWYNLGLAYHQQGRIPEAIRAYQTAIKYENPLLEEAYNNLAQDLLLNREWEKGWKLYENRITRMKNTFKIYHDMMGLPWEGHSERRKCKRLIIICEQGLGDTIQFCRLIKLLEEKEIDVVLFCQEQLRVFLKKTTMIKNITSSLTGCTKETRWCPLMSLGDRLNITGENIPEADGYIKVEKEKASEWRNKLNKKKKLLVAIHWQGNRKFEMKMYSRGRSMPYKIFKELASINNIEFVSIQKGEASKDMEDNIGLTYVEGQKLFDMTYDFRDTAGVLANCDVLISTDSSVVHVAGAMGIPVWIALSYVPEWRWGIEGSKSAWYKSAKLFRQNKQGDWVGVIKQIKKELEQMATK